MGNGRINELSKRVAACLFGVAIGVSIMLVAISVVL